VPTAAVDGRAMDARATGGRGVRFRGHLLGYGPGPHRRRTATVRTLGVWTRLVDTAAAGARCCGHPRWRQRRDPAATPRWTAGSIPSTAIAEAWRSPEAGRYPVPRLAAAGELVTFDTVARAAASPGPGSTPSLICGWRSVGSMHTTSRGRSERRACRRSPPRQRASDASLRQRLEASTPRSAGYARRTGSSASSLPGRLGSAARPRIQDGPARR
jgi:hypothetical protein